jgi:hypothetical protein
MRFKVRFGKGIISEVEVRGGFGELKSRFMFKGGIDNR